MKNKRRITWNNIENLEQPRTPRKSKIFRKEGDGEVAMFFFQGMYL